MIDTHAHLADKRFNSDREEVIKRAWDNNVEEILCICSDYAELETFSELLKKHDFIHGAIGVHPHDSSGYNEEQLITAINDINPSALGEIGLDYHYNHSPKDVQLEVFKKQLNIAKTRELPVIIHSREAMADTLKILKEENINNGVMHCFSGNEREMRECLELGLYISIAGPVTFPGAEKLKSVASIAPGDRLLIETDSPYLAPQPVRGKRNEPSWVKYILEELSELRNVPRDELERQTAGNARSLFNFNKK